MKRLFLMVAAAAFSAVAWAWKPVFVGHRGCGNGVENTVEAYRYGVTHYGYAGLECDVKVSADGQYIISHDNTTTRLGGQLDVNQIRFRQIKVSLNIWKIKQQRQALTVMILQELQELLVQQEQAILVKQLLHLQEQLELLVKQLHHFLEQQDTLVQQLHLLQEQLEILEQMVLELHTIICHLMLLNIAGKEQLNY